MDFDVIKTSVNNSINRIKIKQSSSCYPPSQPFEKTRKPIRSVGFVQLCVMIHNIVDVIL